MIRRSFLVTTLLIVSIGLASATPIANTPPDRSNTVDTRCLLDGLSFSNGLSLVPGFKSNIFNYDCSCAWNTNTFKSIGYPSPLDPDAWVDVTFNGQKIRNYDLDTAISIGGKVTHAPNIDTGLMTFAGGDNNIVIGVGVPNCGCYYEYKIHCYKPPGGYVVGDPQFVGLRGQQYQVHGVAGQIYNIVSDEDLQYNSKFVFLDAGACPIVNGKKLKGCWSHPGSYLGELGLKTRAGDRIHIQTGSAKEGFKSITVNNKPLEVGDIIQFGDSMGFISYNSTHLSTVQIGVWNFDFENSDRFVNQRVRVLDSRNLHSHGLLGQTWRDATYPNPIKYIEGTVDDYAIRSGGIFGDAFLYSVFRE